MTLCQQQGRARVPEIVKPDAPKAGRCAKLREALGDVVRLERRTAESREHEVRILPTTTGSHPLGGLPGADLEILNQATLLQQITGSSVTIITDDTNMITRALLRELSAVRPPEKYRLPASPLSEND